MILSDLSIRRPVVCTVASLVLVLVGALAFLRMPVREYPDLDVPAVSITTVYPGASADVVESKITEPVEEQLATIDGIRIMRSVSREQVSQITLEFDLERDADEAANDVRDRVSRARGRLPDEVDEPIVSKIESDANPFLWVAFYSDRYSQLELTDMVDRIAKQRAQTVPGVGNVIIGGERRYAMRVWLKPELLAAFGLASGDVEEALRRQNVDIPGGRIESLSREFTVRTLGEARTPEAFGEIVVATRGDRQIKIRDLGRVELGAEDYRTRTFFNGRPAVGLGIVQQSKANLLDVDARVKKLLPSIMAEMPEGVRSEVAFDTAAFVQRSVDEVYHTLGIASLLVVLVIFAFLRDARATLVPLLAIPVSLTGSFFFLAALGFSVNILTLLALVLAVGLVVDDAIVVLENIYRRIELGEAPVMAAVRGSRQVAFAVVATSLTLAAVFLPLAFQQGSVGRLFYEFGITLAVAVLVSTFVALTLTPMLCSRVLVSKRGGEGIRHGWFYRATEPFFVAVNARYAGMLRACLRRPIAVAAAAAALALAGPFFFLNLQQELVPLEDRGNFLSIFRAPLGSTPDYTERYVAAMDRIVREQPEVRTNFSVTALGRGTPGNGNEGLMFTNLKPWEERERSTQEVIGRVAGLYGGTITGGLAFPIPRKPLGQRGSGEGVQFVLRGLDFQALQGAADALLGEMRASGLFDQPRKEPSPNKPQLDVEIDRERAGDLDVSAREIAETLETLFGGREVTRFKRGSKEYEVIVRLEDADRVTPEDLGRVYVRAGEGGGQLVQLRTLVHPREGITAENYSHFDRLRSVTLLAQTAPGVALGEAVAFMERIARERLPGNIGFAWDGEAREFVDGRGDAGFLFGLALLFTFLILAAQFESWLHPVTIYSGVALALAGGVFCLWATRFFGPPMTDNLFSRFGLIMLIGLIAKNGILIVEFANQLQVEGKNALEAAFEAAALRFRPILMTAISTIFGAVPIAFATGAGAETRNPLGTVVVGGMSIATVLTLFVVPAVYVLLDRLVVRLTGHSSAHGLRRAAEIEEEERRALAG